MRIVMVLATALPLTGCMTTAGLIASPVTSTVSSWAMLDTEARLMHDSDVMGCCSLVLVPMMIPAGALVATVRGIEKDAEFARTGSYRVPGSMKLQLVFDPWSPRPGMSAVDLYYAPVKRATKPGGSSIDPEPATPPAVTDRRSRAGPPE